MSNAQTLRPIHEIAMDIYRDWGKKVSPYALPYLDAMFSITSATDKYMFDSADTIVRYFLCNASTYRGDKAKQFKQELKQHVGLK